MRYLLDWYSGNPPYKVSPLQGIRNACGKNIKVTYTDENRMDEAVKAAKSADVAIVVVGNNPIGAINEWKVSPVPSDGKEAVDRKSLTLEQEDLVKLVYQANPKYHNGAGEQFSLCHQLVGRKCASHICTLHITARNWETDWPMSFLEK